MAKCNQCLHKYVCEIRTCAECVGGYCDECQLYCEYDGKPDIENCEYFINEEKPFNVLRCKNCKHKGWVQEPCHGKSIDWCKLHDICIKETDYCSYGERKD